MEQDPAIGAAGGSLVSRDGSWQPSARMFPSPLNDLLAFTGMAARFPRSRFFGRFDRTWADSDKPCEVDWVPGAFTILKAEALARIGFFDPAFFLYYEEVDLCRRIRAAGYRIHYQPDIVVTIWEGNPQRPWREVRCRNRAHNSPFGGSEANTSITASITARAQQSPCTPNLHGMA